MSKRFVANTWVYEHHPDSSTRGRVAELVLDAAGTPRFPSFLLTLEQARKLQAALAAVIAKAEAHV